SGFAGTCTVATIHAGGIRVKADGQGTPGSGFKLNVVDVTGPLHLRTTEYVDVNQQGSFRTSWNTIEPAEFTPGDSLQCWLTSPSDGSVLASSTASFPAP